MTCVIGLPQVILANEKTVKFDTSEDPFKILDACKQLPRIVFEYDCMCFFGDRYKLFLLEDGWLVRENYDFSMLDKKKNHAVDFEDLIINSLELAKAIKQLIRENKEELKSLMSKHILNPSICDGASETFRFGRIKIEGSNILTLSMEGYEENLRKYNAVEMGWKKDLSHFQRIFKKFQSKFHEICGRTTFQWRRNRGRGGIKL